MAKSGEKIYLVIEVGCPDAGWPVSVFSTLEKALAECKRLAEEMKSFHENQYTRLMPKGPKNSFTVKRNKGKNPGYLVYAKTNFLSGRGFEIEEYVLDASKKHPLYG